MSPLAARFCDVRVYDMSLSPPILFFKLYRASLRTFKVFRYLLLLA